MGGHIIYIIIQLSDVCVCLNMFVQMFVQWLSFVIWSRKRSANEQNNLLF